MIHSIGVNKQYKSQLIFFYWSKIVGHDIAAQSKPAEIEYGILFLTVKNSVWSHHLSMMKIDIIAKINHFIGEALVKDIRFRNYEFDDTVKTIEKKNEGPNLGKFLRHVTLEKKEIEQVNQQCELIQDENLRVQLVRLYQKNLKLHKLEKQYDWHPCQKCQVLCPKEQLYCNICERESRHEIEAKIRKILSDVPWARYADIYKYISCSQDMVNKERVKMMQKLVTHVDPEDSSSMDAKTLTMLYRCIPPDQLNEDLIKKTLYKFRHDLPFRKNLKKISKNSPKQTKAKEFRRTNHVSASRK